MRYAFALSVGSVLLSLSALAMPPPYEAERPGETVDVKVRRITQIVPISTSAPPPEIALKGKHRLLVVLVDTADSPWPTELTREHYRKLVFEPSGNSLAAFYRENSYGLYELTGEVVGPVRLPGRMTDYAYARSSNDGDRVDKLVELAARAAAKKTKLESFDTHNSQGRRESDGALDHLMLIYAEKTGKDNGFSPIWPHRGSLDISVSKVRIPSYTILNHAAHLGVYVHEFGHDIGLPDLYDRDYSSHGAGAWCTMGSGSWLGGGKSPGHISAWAKIRLGWIVPTMVSESVEKMSVPSSSDVPFALKIPLGEVDSQEYFIVENRRRIGFDKKIAGQGLLIWHIDQSKGDNDDENRKMVDVVEASKVQDLDTRDRYRSPKHAPDLFSLGGNSIFDDDSTPSARSNSGRPSDISLHVLSPAQSVMQVRIRRPKIFNPGGQPYTLTRDGYVHGRFGAVPLGAGSEALVQLDATAGGYLAFLAEAWVSGRPKSRETLVFRIYADRRGKPGKVLVQAVAKVTLPREGFMWARAPLSKNHRGYKLKAHRRVWVGVTSQKGTAYPASNPFSISKLARYRRKQSSSKIRSTFNFKGAPRTPAADYIVRLQGFGFIEGSEKPALPASDADPQIVLMRAIDKKADAGQLDSALREYQKVLARMQADHRRYESWIPVLVNAIGVVAYRLKKYDLATERFEMSLRRALAAKDQPNTADIYENLGETAFFAGHYDKAVEHCTLSRTINERLKRSARTVENLYWLARSHQELKEPDKGRGLLDETRVAVRLAFAKDANQEAIWMKRIQLALDGTPEDQPQIKRAKEDETGPKQKAVYTNLLQFLSEDTTAGE